ncbi:DNA internalization-related competence protein ComEC/Rec2 [Pseudomonas oligotrophica]|uniref:DNA internalization-related competence protein ComEC/Rec2 n=1 Tax=Pseudomonas oligotrophica TaxID=2912055 RepID=UPI001F01B938|nr:DNA internalization-related competence protein ComEC/Rec2 [Pseudomonas oligotrophica]MCF7202279.1 DNA internalization-related competence protein ComEC/Rec2 [Pseudomonas oligotrophica]
MRTWMAALAVGLILPRFLPGLPAPAVLVMLGCAALPALCWRRLRAPALLLLGFAWACWQAHLALADRLPARLDGRALWLEGTVTGLPAVADGVTRFELTEIRSRHAGLPSRIRLGWYAGPALQAGERWRVAARLKRPHGLVNPQAFDYEAWLLAQGIGASGTVKTGERLTAGVSPSTWRDTLRSRLATDGAWQRGGAIAALVVGDDAGLSHTDWQLLQDTGTVHLLVISGQHVAMLAGLLYGLVALLYRLGLWPARMPWVPAAVLLAIAGALGYAWLAGFEVPVQRACVMVALVLLWRLRYRHLGVWFPLLLALDLVLLANPLATLQPGFWLSFAAVALLALVFAGRLGSWRWWQTLPRAQLAMTIGLLPPMLLLGLPVSLSGPLANLVAVPWVSLTVPFALLGSALLTLSGALGEPLLVGVGFSLQGLFRFLAWVAAWQPAWVFAQTSIWVVLAAAAGALLMLLPAGVPLRLLGVVLLLPLGFAAAPRPEVGEAQVRVLDVGQGLSVLVLTRHHALLYDAGPRHGTFDLGERVVAPSLRRLGAARLDMLLLSHADSDHAGGAAAVLRAIPTRRVVSGEPGRLALPAVEACAAGEHWQWDGVDFRLWQWSQADDGNAASCVLAVEAGGERLLLSGDLDSRGEQALLDSGLPVASQWLLLGHHGSRTSSSPAFLAAVAPHAAVVSRSRHNPFGHPHETVLRRLDEAGIVLYDTALDGALRIDLGRFAPAEGLRWQRRFWRQNENDGRRLPRSPVLE